MSASRSIVIERRLTYSPDKVWRALTEGALIAQWLMANDFRAEVGHRFTFKARPMGDWDGIVQCEVLACEPRRLLRYSWIGGSPRAGERSERPARALQDSRAGSSRRKAALGGAATNQTYGSRLDSTVTFTLTPVEGGTHLKLEHAGFRSPDNDFAYDAMSPGWGRIAEGLERVLATLQSVERLVPLTRIGGVKRQ